MNQKPLSKYTFWRRLARMERKARSENLAPRIDSLNAGSGAENARVSTKSKRVPPAPNPFCLSQASQIELQFSAYRSGYGRLSDSDHRATLLGPWLVLSWNWELCCLPEACSLSSQQMALVAMVSDA